MVPIIIIQKERIVKELVQGQDSACQLQALLQKSVDEKLIDGDDLMLKILNSFSEALSLLGTCAPHASDSVVTSQVDSVCSEDSGDSRKRPSSTTATSSRPPASYKRKKTANSVRKVSPTIEDGYAWRKYGQKDILNATYPRSYFRCTHKYEKGCTATKQVQRREDDPSLYLITYIGTHSCSPLQLPAATAPNYYSWDPNHSINPILSDPTIKEEECHHEQQTPTDLATHLPLWKDVMPFDDHRTAAIYSPAFVSIDFDADFQYFDDSQFNYL